MCNVNISVHAIMLCVVRCMHYTAYVGVTKRGRGVVPIAPPTVRSRNVICMDLHYSVQTESSVVRKLESLLDGSFFVL